MSGVCKKVLFIYYVIIFFRLYSTYSTAVHCTRHTLVTRFIIINYKSKIKLKQDSLNFNLKKTKTIEKYTALIDKVDSNSREILGDESLIESFANPDTSSTGEVIE